MGATVLLPPQQLVGNGSGGGVGGGGVAGGALPAVSFCAAEAAMSGGGPGSVPSSTAGVSRWQLRYSWILPEVLPRRFFSFYMGGETCEPGPRRDLGGRPPPRLGFIDGRNGVLVIPALCPTTTTAPSLRDRPRVFLECPVASDMCPSGPDAVLRAAAVGWQHELEAKYRGRADVRVHWGGEKDPAPGEITAVELVALPRPQQRGIAGESREALAVRAGWGPPSAAVLEVPLGLSASYTVRCGSLGHEDLFLYPVALPPAAEASDGAWNRVGNHSDVGRGVTGNTTVVGEGNTDGGHDNGNNTPPTASVPAPPPPQRNVLVLMLDAVSRPEVLRSLPLFTQWMRGLQARRGGSGGGDLVVAEGRGHTTFGFSTGGNLPPSLSGTTALIEGADSETYPNVTFLKRTLFALAKRRYGPRLRTSLAMGYCHNLLHAVFGGAADATGGGGRPLPLSRGDDGSGLDRYLYAPMCDGGYSARESNIHGPYSIRQRCLGGRHVHEHLLDYTAHLLREHQRQGGNNSNGGSSSDGVGFFDVSYFVEGHEGSHSVLSQVDAALVAFLETLLRSPGDGGGGGGGGGGGNKNDYNSTGSQDGEGIGFFDDPRNVLVIYADHGSHMGPYYLASDAGRMERTSPLLLFAMHRSALDNIDAEKKKINNDIGRTMTTTRNGGSSVSPPPPPLSSYENFLQRTSGLTTPADLFLTLADLLGVGDLAEVAANFAMAEWPPRSLFDAMPARTEESQRRTGGGRFRVSSDDVVNTSMRALERFPLASYWCDFNDA